jgi:hypothetical protein
MNIEKAHFGIREWGRPKGLTNRSFGRKHEKEAGLFVTFFKPKEGAI